MVKSILHVIESLRIGGAEKLLCNTISELQEYEHLIITVFDDNDLTLLPSNAKHISLKAKSKADVFFKIPTYKKILKTYKPNIVHSHLYFATILAKAGTPSSIPLIFTQHFEFSKNATKWYYRFTDRIVSTKKQICIAVSNVVLRDYVQYIGFKGKQRVIGIYIPDHYFTIKKANEYVSGYELKMVAVGNIKSIKNQQYIINAFEYMKDLAVSCTIYGEGPEREKLQKEANSKKVRVFFKGPIADSSAVLADYHIFIMPSQTEGFPLALFEAMACALPPIVSDIPVFHELLEGNGDFVSLQDPKEVRPVIDAYLRHPELLIRRGVTVKEVAQAKATRVVYLQKLRKLYQEVAS